MRQPQSNHRGDHLLSLPTHHEAIEHRLLRLPKRYLLGGGGKTKAVLDRLGEKLKSVLKPKDYEPHESNAKQIRWRNTAQWARNLMVNEDGRMKKTSPRGMWEISEKGRAWLRQHPNE